jgi:hypothetical protein
MITIDKNIARAVLAFAAANGRCWKRELSRGWAHARFCGELQMARNTLGPAWLSRVTIAQLQAAAD